MGKWLRFQPLFHIKRHQAGLSPVSTTIRSLSGSLFTTYKGQPSIRGVTVSKYQHKVAAYADDLLFYITEPLTSLPSLLQELKCYSRLFNFKVYLQKSEALNISLSDATRASLRPYFPFKWADRSIQYLGTKIPVNLNDILPLNYQPFLSTLTADLKKMGYSGPLLVWALQRT